MGIGKGLRVFELHFDVQSLLEIVQRGAQLAISPVLAGQVVVGDDLLVQRELGVDFGALQELQRVVEALLAQVDHRHGVAELAELVRGLLVLLAVLAEGVLFEHQHLLQHVQALEELARLLELVCALLELQELLP